MIINIIILISITLFSIVLLDIFIFKLIKEYLKNNGKHNFLIYKNYYKEKLIFSFNYKQYFEILKPELVFITNSDGSINFNNSDCKEYIGNILCEHIDNVREVNEFLEKYNKSYLKNQMKNFI